MADTNSDRFYIQAVDTNGGVSNTAFINVVHTGVASLESNFAQVDEYSYHRSDFDLGYLAVSPNVYYTGLKPNLNDTQVQTENIVIDLNGEYPAPDDTFNLVVSADAYTKVKVNIPSFPIYLRTKNAGNGKARARVTIMLDYEGSPISLRQISSVNDSEQTFTIPEISYTIASLPSGSKLRVYLLFAFDNVRGSNSGSMDVWTTVNDFMVNISTTKTL